MKEIFKDIPGWEGKYQASNFGRVKKMKFGKNGKERMLKPTTWRKYKKVSFAKNGHRYYFWVHRLVWEAFNGPIPEGMVINHIDENPENNNLINLMVCTQKENNIWGTAIQRRIQTFKKNYKTPSPETIAERKEKRKRYQKERREKIKRETLKRTLQNLGITEEEYLKKKEEQRREKKNAYQREYYKNNKEKIKETNKKWKTSHLEEVKSYHKEYWEKNKHKYRVNNAS